MLRLLAKLDGRRSCLPLALALSLLASAAPAAETSVNTPEAAIAAARRTWQELYEKGRWHAEFGPNAVARFEPYTASNHDGVWTVRGTIPPGYHGVALVTTVRQSDGSVQVQEVDVPHH